MVTFSLDMNLPNVLIPLPSNPSIIGVSAVIGGPWANTVVAERMPKNIITSLFIPVILNYITFGPDDFGYFIVVCFSRVKLN